MKKLIIFVFAIVLFAPGTSHAQVPPLDKSPLDVSYYPNKYPLLKVQDKVTDPLVARVIYSRPQKNGRVIFGNLLDYGKLWRLGANEATEIEFFQPVIINNVKIKSGRYTLYAIPDINNWTYVLNKELDTWGSFKYDSTKDVVRATVPVQPQADSTEAFSLYFEKAPTGFVLNAQWENIKTSLPISLQ